MLSQIPFIYVNLLALCSFLLMFTAFAASKKTPVIRVFMVVLGDCILWSGSCVLMRLQMWPSMHFWYYVSLVTLFIMELLFYWFVHTFYRQKGKLSLLLCFLGTAAILPGTVTGFYLAPPTPVRQADGGVVFLYDQMNWHILIPCVLFVAIIVMTACLLLKLVRQQGVHSPGLMVIIWGGLVMLTGNLMQIAIPGNTFPYDALAGVIFAALLMSALYKRRMFRMTLLVSRGILAVALALVCIVMATNLITPLRSFALEELHLSDASATVLAALAFAGVLVLSYTLLRKLVDAMFTREEQQDRQLKRFTTEVSQTLSTMEIMAKLSSAVTAEIGVERVYICQKEGGEYVAKYCSRPLELTNFSISETSPQITYLREQEDYLISSEFQSSPLYLSAWESEKELFRRLAIDCVVAMKDGKEVIGLLLLAAREKGKRFDYNEISYLETICSVASIAMKNAGLYEKMFREARIDPLTGVYNYRYFVEKEAELFEACRDDCLSLIFADVDDFKLYNQLYGVEAGDAALCQISKEITLCVGESGTVFRTSGKVFGILLPHVDPRRAKTLAEEICRRVRAINRTPEGKSRKPLSLSVGICSAPYAASSAKELRDHADLAAYNAKQSGKDCITLFREAAAAPQRLAERTELIVGRIEQEGRENGGTLAMISALTAAIDAKDHYTFDHSKNVARYAASLAVGVGLNDEQVRTIYAAGLLHDIGKISIPEEILRKTGKLTDSEYDVMKSHVNSSIEMIRHLPDMDYLIPAVLGHHERWDGRGYPRGIQGEEIPLSARCLSIADAFDAMITDRPYRKGLPVEYAIQQLREGAGKQFDPQLAPVFAQMVEERQIPLAVDRGRGRRRDESL